MNCTTSQRQQLAAVGVARARAAFACAMAQGSWSTMPYLGVITTDHKPHGSRRLGVPSP